MKNNNSKRPSLHLNSSANSGITQPVAESKSTYRSKKIKQLHQQYDQLRKKIKDISDRNQKVFQNISKYNGFKKNKSQNRGSYSATPIVHYENKQDMSQVLISKKTHKESNQVEYKGVIKKNSNIRKNIEPFHQSLQYNRTSENIFSESKESHDLSSSKSHNKSKSNVVFRPAIIPSNMFIYSPSSQYIIPSQQQFFISQFNGMNPYPISMRRPDDFKPNMVTSSMQTYQKEQVIKKQSQKIRILQEQLEKRESDMVAYRKLQKKWNNITNHYNEVIQQELQKFFDGYIRKKMTQIQKYMKKNENKLKKIKLKINDGRQEKKSRKMLLQHRQRRSKSRSKNSVSSTDQLNNLHFVRRISSKRSTYQLGIPHESLSKQSEPIKSSQQFEEIANHYQQLVNLKQRQNQQLENKLSQKQDQLLKMTNKCNKLESKLSELNDIGRMSKSRKSSQKQQNLLSNLNYDNQSQIFVLNKKIREFENMMIQKDRQLKQRQQDNIKRINDLIGKIKLKDNEIIRINEQNKRMQRQLRSDDCIISKLKKFEMMLKQKDNDYNIIKQKNMRLQNDKIKISCQNISLLNKIKKLQNELQIKQNKMIQLQKIIQTNNEHQDFQQKSIYLQKINYQQLQKLQQQKQQLQQQLHKLRQIIFKLQKQKQLIQKNNKEIKINNQNLNKKIYDLNIIHQNINKNINKIQQFDIRKKNTQLERFIQSQDCISENDDDDHIKIQLAQLRNKYQDLQNLLKIQNQKTFDENRKVLRLTSQLQYYKQQLLNKDGKYQKLKKQYEQMKYEINMMQQKIIMKDTQIELQRRMNEQKMREYEMKYNQFQKQIKINQDEGFNNSQLSQLRNSRQNSQLSFSNYIFNSNNSQRQKLIEKLKSLQKILQIQRQSEQKIIKQYKMNIQKIRYELKQKTRQYENILQQNERLLKKINNIQNNNKYNEDKKYIINQSYQKNINLEKQLNIIKEINYKRQNVQQQLYYQINQKQKLIQELMLDINNKQRKIQQLTDLLQLKAMNISSHISTTQIKPKMRQSIQSHNSLRYSMLSNNTNKDKTIQLDLSQISQSVIDHNQSIISNIQQVFARQQFPYQKMKLQRKQQRKLFQKTVAYIKSLKNAIQQKNKRIKLLQKKIQSLRNSQLVRKDIYQIKVDKFNDLQANDSDIFKDYYSVQLQRQNNNHFRSKRLEHETRLTIQQNNLLNNQIQNLQSEIMKAQQQQDSLMKLKDLYKDQIKSLIKQNQDQAKLFEQQIKKQKIKNEKLKQFKTFESLRQIFLKIYKSFISLQGQLSSKSKKRQQKKKQLQQYLKISCNLFEFDNSMRDKILIQFKQIKR